MGHECKGHIFHQAMFHFSNRVKIRKTLKIVLTMNPSLHGERDVNVGSFEMIELYHVPELLLLFGIYLCSLSDDHCQEH